MTVSSARWWLLSILLAAAVLRLVLVLVLPYDGAPDERYRYDVAARIYGTGRAPRYGVETTSHFVVKPIFGYRVNAFLAHAVPGDLPLFRKLRVGSVLVSLAAIGLAYAACRNLWPQRPGLALALATVLAFHPQFAFLGAYLNADAYTIFAVTAVWYVLTRIHRHAALQPSMALALGVALGLVFLGRENGYAAFILAAGYGIYLLRQQWATNGRRLALALAVFLLFPAVFYLHQYQQYGKAYIPLVTGSGIAWVPPGMTVAQAYAELPKAGYDYPVMYMDWLDYRQWIALALLLFWSSIGVFGYMDIFFPALLYPWFLIIVFFGAVGLVRAASQRQRWTDAFDTSRRWLLASAAVAALALIAVVVRHNFVVISQPQGRYLLPLLAPVSLLLLNGWRSISRYAEIGRFIAALSVVSVMVGGSWAAVLLANYYV